MYRKDLIRAKIVNLDLNMKTFAKASGLGLHTAKKLWNGATNIELTSLDKASKFLDLSLEELFQSDHTNSNKQVSADR